MGRKSSPKKVKCTPKQVKDAKAKITEIHNSLTNAVQRAARAQRDYKRKCLEMESDDNTQILDNAADELDVITKELVKTWKELKNAPEEQITELFEDALISLKLLDLYNDVNLWKQKLADLANVGVETTYTAESSMSRNSLNGRSDATFQTPQKKNVRRGKDETSTSLTPKTDETVRETDQELKDLFQAKKASVETFKVEATEKRSKRLENESSSSDYATSSDDSIGTDKKPVTKKDKKHSHKVEYESDSDELSETENETYSNGKAYKGHKRIPQLKMKVFEGNLEDYEAWWADFKQVVHKNPGLSDLERIMYLRQSTSGPAADLAMKFREQGTDYKAAILEMHKMYRKKGALSAMLTKKIETLPPAKGDAASMRSTYNKLEGLVMQLKKAEKNADNSFLHAKVNSKFSRDIRKQLAPKAASYESRHDEPWSVDRLLKEINKLIIAEEAVEERLSDSDTEQVIAAITTQHHVKDQSKKAYNGNASQMQVTKTVNSEKPPTECRFCNAYDHRSSKCKAPVEVAQKIAIMKTTKGCWRCVDGNHMAKDCTHKEQPCWKCGGRHHGALCYGIKQVSPNGNNAQYHQAMYNPWINNQYGGGSFQGNQFGNVQPFNYIQTQYNPYKSQQQFVPTNQKTTENVQKTGQNQNFRATHTATKLQ